MAVQQHVAALIFEITLRARTAALVSLAVLATVLTIVPTAQAQSFQVLHAFMGQGDGASPEAGLIMDRAGRLYGTTSGGFVSQNADTAFKLVGGGSGWVFYTLYEFSSQSDEIGPGQLTFGPDGNLYGPAIAGGDGSCNNDTGCGAIFRLQPPPNHCTAFLCYWTHTALYNFIDISDGFAPSAIAFDAAGNIYGTTIYGGSDACSGEGCGSIFKLTPSGGGWTKTILYSFQAADDGKWPSGAILFDAASNLYGTAEGGAANHGVVYELSPSNGAWTYTVLHTFEGSDGSGPGGLIADSTGNLYGTTGVGGSGDDGTVFELAHPGNWTFESLYSFTNSRMGTQPAAGLVFDAAGNLYGSLGTGGANDLGAIFKLSLSNSGWVQADLHDFSEPDGYNPNGSLIFDSRGSLYGTASEGGFTGGQCYIGCGTIWELTP
jgi:uncharacterized repeat protein (TIGR03803 family)